MYFRHGVRSGSESFPLRSELFFPQCDEANSLSELSTDTLNVWSNLGESESLPIMIDDERNDLHS